ncbi:hypothetical protein BC936DRAFT_138460 [Jimgerdemannia flammicorona]|uniref:Protein kinase domain-containing protein n=1 Tax=Jimgerdemannia flammicorona TaxID=994334 RepID=A0A433CDL6_9FUNG|nr:hypothetical protein BC936DRAFT_138460 [Jimgerdemannia flammicorona]
MEAINKNQAKNNTRSLSIEAINISKAKQLVTPFAELDDYDQRDITKLKNAFAQYDSILLEHLTRFDLGELSDRLAWIPFELFKDVRKLAKGGFGTVFVAGLDFPSVYVSEDGMVALKVLDENLLHEKYRSGLYIHAVSKS